jgi:hypothetical protein
MDSRMIPTRFTETNVGDMFIGMLSVRCIRLYCFSSKNRERDHKILLIKYMQYTWSLHSILNNKNRWITDLKISLSRITTLKYDMIPSGRLLLFNDSIVLRTIYPSRMDLRGPTKNRSLHPVLLNSHIFSHLVIFRNFLSFFCDVVIWPISFKLQLRPWRVAFTLLWTDSWTGTVRSLSQS